MGLKKVGLESGWRSTSPIKFGRWKSQNLVWLWSQILSYKVWKVNAALKTWFGCGLIRRWKFATDIYMCKWQFGFNFLKVTAFIFIRIQPGLVMVFAWFCLFFSGFGTWSVTIGLIWFYVIWYGLLVQSGWVGRFSQKLSQAKIFKRAVASGSSSCEFFTGLQNRSSRYVRVKKWKMQKKRHF